MRIAVCIGKGHIEIQERPVPEAGADRILVKVTLCGICSTDVAVWQGNPHARKRYPCSPGHEFCGTVDRVGANVTAFRVGDRVVIDPNLGCGACRYCRSGTPNLCDRLKTRNVKSNGGLSEYVAIDSRMAYALSPDLSDELAVFVEPLSCALHIARTAGATTGEKGVVFGCGIMGLLTGFALKQADLSPVLVDRDESRRKEAAAILDVDTFDPGQFSDSAVFGQYDFAIDCTGNIKAIGQAIEAVRKGACLVLGGLVADADSTAGMFAEITMKELVVRGAWLNPNVFQEAVELVEKNRATLEKISTELYRLSDVSDAFKQAASGSVHRVLVAP